MSAGSNPSLRGGRAARPALLLVLLATVAVFGPSVSADFVWDDWALIVRNQLVRDPAHLPDVLTSPFWNVSSQSTVGRLAYVNLYRPVVSLAYVTQFQVFGENPVGYHMVSLLLHLACVVMAYAWIRRRLEHRSSELRAPVDLAAAVGVLPFALHSSRPETVTWISGSTDLWMTFWVLAAALALGQRRRLVRGLGGLAVALACLSKEAAIVLPVLLVADAWLVEGRRPEAGREGIALAGAVAGTGVHLYFVPPAGGQGVALEGLSSRVLASLGHFVHRTFDWFDPSVEPVPREFDAGGHEVFAPWAIGLGAALVVVVILLAALAHRQTPSLRPWLADLLWFLLPLIPVANLVALEGPTVVADRYLFLPLLGIGAGLARTVFPLVDGPARRLVATGAILLAVALGVPSGIHARRFEDDGTLWSYEYERNPRSFSAINGVAEVARSEGEPGRAIRVYTHGRRVAMDRNQPGTALVYALRIAALLVTVTSDADQSRLNDLRELFDGLSEDAQLRIDVPELHLDERIPRDTWRRWRDHPTLVLLPRAMAHLRTGRLESAESLLHEVLAEDPRRAAAWNLLIAVHGRRLEWDAARDAYERAARRVPGDESVAAMGQALARAYALSMTPVPSPIAVAIRNARVQRELGAPEAARRILDAALEHSPHHPPLVLERARTDVADRRFDLARQVLERARAEDPANASRWDEALRRLSEAERSVSSASDRPPTDAGF